MKTFHGSYIYRGANFIISFCAKTYKAAALLVDTTEYQIKTYYSVGMDKTITGVIAEPYGTRTVIDYGFGKEKIQFESIEHLNKVIDEKANKYWNKANINKIQ